MARVRLNRVAERGQDRDDAASVRDCRAAVHDQASEARDDRADARDERADARERIAGAVIDVRAVADRESARRDRSGGRADRVQAADDRRSAASDRDLAAAERAVSSIDALTRAYRRDAGSVELTRDVTRAKRTGQQFVLAFIDVDNLKAVNDSRGHAAGDKLLRDVANAVRAHVRSYDLLIRFGGDEFVCGLADLSMSAASTRFDRVNAELAALHASIGVGLAELGEHDELEDLLARADLDMYAHRQPPRLRRA